MKQQSNWKTNLSNSALTLMLIIIILCLYLPLIIHSEKKSQTTAVNTPLNFYVPLDKETPYSLTMMYLANRVFTEFNDKYDINIVNTTGSLDSVLKLDNNKHGVALAQADSIYHYIKGDHRLIQSKKTKTDIRSIGEVLSEWLIITPGNKTQATALEQGKNICIGKIGSGTQITSLNLLDTLGIEAKTSIDCDSPPPTSDNSDSFALEITAPRKNSLPRDEEIIGLKNESINLIKSSYRELYNEIDLSEALSSEQKEERPSPEGDKLNTHKSKLNKKTISVNALLITNKKTPDEIVTFLSTELDRLRTQNTAPQFSYSQIEKLQEKLEETLSSSQQPTNNPNLEILKKCTQEDKITSCKINFSSLTKDLDFIEKQEIFKETDGSVTFKYTIIPHSAIQLKYAAGNNSFIYSAFSPYNLYLIFITLFTLILIKSFDSIALLLRDLLRKIEINNYKSPLYFPFNNSKNIITYIPLTLISTALFIYFPQLPSIILLLTMLAPLLYLLLKSINSRAKLACYYVITGFIFLCIIVYSFYTEEQLSLEQQIIAIASFLVLFTVPINYSINIYEHFIEKALRLFLPITFSAALIYGIWFLSYISQKHIENSILSIIAACSIITLMTLINWERYKNYNFGASNVTDNSANLRIEKLTSFIGGKIGDNFNWVKFLGILVILFMIISSLRFSEFHYTENKGYGEGLKDIPQTIYWVLKHFSGIGDNYVVQSSQGVFILLILKLFLAFSSVKMLLSPSNYIDKLRIILFGVDKKYMIFADFHKLNDDYLENHSESDINQTKKMSYPIDKNEKGEILTKEGTELNSYLDQTQKIAMLSAPRLLIGGDDMIENQAKLLQKSLIETQRKNEKVQIYIEIQDPAMKNRIESINKKSRGNSLDIEFKTISVRSYSYSLIKATIKTPRIFELLENLLITSDDNIDITFNNPPKTGGKDFNHNDDEIILGIQTKNANHIQPFSIDEISNPNTDKIISLKHHSYNHLNSEDKKPVYIPAIDKNQKNSIHIIYSRDLDEINKKLINHKDSFSDSNTTVYNSSEKLLESISKTSPNNEHNREWIIILSDSRKLRDHSEFEHIDDYTLDLYKSIKNEIKNNKNVYFIVELQEKTAEYNLEDENSYFITPSLISEKLILRSLLKDEIIIQLYEDLISDSNISIEYIPYTNDTTKFSKIAENEEANGLILIGLYKKQNTSNQYSEEILVTKSIRDNQDVKKGDILIAVKYNP